MDAVGAAVFSIVNFNLEDDRTISIWLVNLGLAEFQISLDTEKNSKKCTFPHGSLGNLKTERIFQI